MFKPMQETYYSLLYEQVENLVDQFCKGTTLNLPNIEEGTLFIIYARRKENRDEEDFSLRRRDVVCAKVVEYGDELDAVFSSLADLGEIPYGNYLVHCEF
jgi:hypothetical protein